MRGFRDKIAIVAGAGPGNISAATALRLAQEGMKVIAVDMNEAAASAVVGVFSEGPWKSWDSLEPYLRQGSGLHWN